MPILKNYLEEELENSIQLKKAYDKELKKLPKGVLIKKKIKGHYYYYLVYRVKDKVKYFYKGKVSKEEERFYQEAKKRRAQVRSLLSQVKKQIHFLKKVIHDRKLQSMP